MSSGCLRALAFRCVVGLVFAALAACSRGGPNRTAAFDSRNYTFAGLETFVGHSGETVEFAMTNRGPADHEFEVFDSDGRKVGEIGPTSAGRTAKVSLTLRRTGAYRFRCDVSDHESRGMTGTFVVS